MKALSPHATRGWSLERKLAHRSRPGVNGCRLWTGKRGSDGFARMWWKGRNVPVHRLAFAVKTGRPAGPLVKVLQRCGHRHCIAPGHLYAGSQDEVTRKTRRPRGEQNGNHKLTAAQVRAIRRSKATQAEIAAQFNVSLTTVGLLRRRIAWAHLR